MAVTITRTARIDDDGTGTTGTVINNAEKTSLYNEIDTALAKVAQLGGANTFTGTQTLVTLNSTAALIFTTTSVERMRIASTGEVTINSVNPVGGAQLTLAADNVGHVIAFGIQNLSATNTLYYAAFYNNAGGPAGSIVQASASTVTFNTGSDARLKTDHGPATDLAALRAVVVHDFTWIADGVRARGVFAQDAHAVFPRAITPGTDDLTESGTLARPWMTDYSKFVPDLIVGFQQHDADLAELRALLAAVKG